MWSVPVSGRFPGGGSGNHSSILAWKLHGQRILVGCSPRGRKESDVTEQLSTHTDSTTPRALRPQTSRLKFWTLVSSSVKCNHSSLESRYGSQSGVGIEKLSGSLSPGSERGQRPREDQAGPCATGGTELQGRSSLRLGELSPRPARAATGNGATCCWRHPRLLFPPSSEPLFIFQELLFLSKFEDGREHSLRLEQDYDDALITKQLPSQAQVGRRRIPLPRSALAPPRVTWGPWSQQPARMEKSAGQRGHSSPKRVIYGLPQLWDLLRGSVKRASPRPATRGSPRNWGWGWRGELNRRLEMEVQWGALGHPRRRCCLRDRQAPGLQDTGQKDWSRLWGARAGLMGWVSCRTNSGFSSLICTGRPARL